MTETLSTEAQAFLDDALPRQLEAERDLHNAELGGRLAMWTREEPRDSVRRLNAAGPAGTRSAPSSTHLPRAGFRIAFILSFRGLKIPESRPAFGNCRLSAEHQRN